MLQLLSPVPVFTSDPLPIPLIFLIPLLRSFSYFLSSFRSCYLLISLVLFPSIPAYPFLSNPFCFHATDNHVLTSTSCLFDHSSAFPPIPIPAPPFDSELLLYLNPLYLSIQSNLIIAFLTLRSVSFCKPPPTHSLPPDSIRLRSLTSPKL